MTTQPAKKPDLTIQVGAANPPRKRVRPAAKPPSQRKSRPSEEDYDTDVVDEDDPFGNSQPSASEDSSSPMSSSTPSPSKRSVIDSPAKSVDKSVPKSGPPSVDEWQDFIGRIVLRTLFDGYMTLMLRDIELSPQEERYLHLSKQDLKEMSAPLAGFANKNKALRKHGRSIVAAADSWESVVAISIWLRRVNRVARRHRAELSAAKQSRRQESNHSHRVAQHPSPTPQPTPVVMQNGGSNGTSGQDEVNGSGPRIRRPDTWRPPHPDFTFNPGSG